MSITGYKRSGLISHIQDPVTREVIFGMDVTLSDWDRRLSTSSAAGSSSIGGSVSGISADGGTLIVGMVNLVSGNAMSLTASGQNITFAVSEGAIDHGSIGGLGGDDHTQYILVDGTRPFTGSQSMGSNKLTGLAVGTASGDALAYGLNDISHLATATGDYDMDGNDFTNIGNITVKTDSTYNIGASGKEFFIVYCNGVLSASTLQIGHSPGSQATLIQFSPGTAYLTCAKTNNIWQAATFAGKPIAVESITQLDELATAGGDYSMGSNALTSVTNIGAPASTKFEIIGYDTDGATAEGIRLNWDANVATPTDGAKYFTVGYTDNGDVFNEMMSLAADATLGNQLYVGDGGGGYECGIGANSGDLIRFNTTSHVMRIALGSNNIFQVSDGIWSILSGGATTFQFYNTSSGQTATENEPPFEVSTDTQKTAGRLFVISHNAFADEEWECDFAGTTLQNGELQFGAGAGFIMTLTHAATAARTWTIPDSTDTFVGESRSISTSTGLTGGGDLSANRTIALDVNALTEQTTPGSGDFVPIYDAGLAAHRKVDVNNLGFKTKDTTIEAPATGEDIKIFRTPVAITITKVIGTLVGSSTPDIDIDIMHNTDRSAAGNAVFAATRTVSSTTTGDDLTLGGDTTVPANSHVWVETSGTPTGTVDYLELTIQYTID